MVGKTIFHYQVLEDLGKSRMGVLYRTRDTKLGRDVALKVLNSTEDDSIMSSDAQRTLYA